MLTRLKTAKRLRTASSHAADTSMSMLAYAFQSRLTAAQFDACFHVLTRSCNATSKLKVLRHPGVCRSYGNTCLYASPIKSCQSYIKADVLVAEMEGLIHISCCHSSSH